MLLRVRVWGIGGWKCCAKPQPPFFGTNIICIFVIILIDYTKYIIQGENTAHQLYSMPEGERLGVGSPGARSTEEGLPALSHSRTPAPTHSRTHTLTHPHTHAPTHSRTHIPTVPGHRVHAHQHP